MRLLIERPSLTLAECAAEVGYSACQVSRIVNSKPFQECITRLQAAALEDALRFSLRPRKAPR